MKEVMKLAQQILDRIIGLFASITPLDSNTIILANYGRKYLDTNNHFFFQYLKKRQRTHKDIPYKIYMIINHHNQNGNLNPFSPRDLFTIIRCRTFFLTHGTGDFFWKSIGNDRRRLFIQLWHGTAIKSPHSKERFYREWKFYSDAFKRKFRNKPKKLPFKSKKLTKYPLRMYWTVGSHFERYLFSAPTKFPFELTIPVGHVQDDYFFTETEIKNYWMQKTQALIEGFDKVVLYAPTFRPSTIKNPQYLPFLSDFSLSELESVLKRYKAILLYRPHIKMLPASYGSKDTYRIWREHLNSPFMKEATFEVIPHVTYLLKYTDILLTDYSGIIYDFLLLDRPIMAIAKDWKLYKRIRGFTMDYQLSFPGPILTNFQDFLTALTSYFENPRKDSELRTHWCNIFRNYTDDKNAYRTYRLFQKLLNGLIS